MRSGHRVTGLVSLFALALLAGCSDTTTNPTPGQITDQSLVSGVVSAAPSLVQDGLMNSNVATAVMAPALNRAGTATATPITPVTFWRAVKTATASYQVAFSDTDTTGFPTTANVTVNWHFEGTLNIIDYNAGADHPVKKPFSDDWVRYVELKRMPSDMDGVEHHDWRIVAISGVVVTSPEATSQIQSIHLHSSTVDTTITDPLVLTRLHDLLRFADGDTVDVTATTGRDDDVVLLYHADHRERMESLGGGQYAARLPAGAFEGWRHFAVNALSHGTLYDDTAAYDSKAWILPYVIASTPVVDHLP